MPPQVLFMSVTPLLLLLLLNPLVTCSSVASSSLKVKASAGGAKNDHSVRGPQPGSYHIKRDSPAKDNTNIPVESSLKLSALGLGSHKQAGLILSVPSDALPNIDYVGRGYNLITGNPHATCSSSCYDPGFGETVFDYTYSGKRSGDQRWSIPDGVDVAEQLVCSYDSSSSDVFGETSYYSQLEASAGVSAGIKNLGSFSASADYKRISNETSSKHEIEVHAAAICSYYKAFLQTFTPPKYNQNFIAAVTQLIQNGSDPSAANKIIQAFGTHYTTTIVMGAKCIIQSLFSQSNYYSMTDQSIDVHTAASLSFKSFTGSAYANGSYEQKVVETYNNKRTTEQYTFIGSKPSTDGNWQTWMQSIQNDPVPFNFMLESLDTLITPAAFPQFPVDVVNKAAVAMQTAIIAYCAGRGISCAGPTPDSQVMTRSISNSGFTEVFYTCPVGIPLNAGMVARSPISPDQYSTNPAYWAVFIGSQLGVYCWAPSDTMTCNGICTNAFSYIWYVVTPSGPGVVNAVCPAGYVVASCGFAGSGGDNFEQNPFSYPLDSTTCSCYDYFGVRCGAVCVPANEVQAYQIVSGYGTGRFTVTCPLNTSLLGCGYKASGGGGEKWWFVGAVSSMECSCYDYFGATCYAICGQF